MSNVKILVVDDDESVRKIIIKSLSRENMSISEAKCGREALSMIEATTFDLVILDIMMEDIDGLEVIKKIRSTGSSIPILILSARNDDYDEILGLGIGADDYVTKPFSPAALCARVKAHIRRNKEIMEIKDKAVMLVQGSFKFNLNTYKFYKNNDEIVLSSKEAILMKFFMEHPNQVFTKEQLYENVWGESIIDNNTIMVYINHLRNKIEDDQKNLKYIKTVWGIGYKFTVDNHQLCK